MIKTKHVVFGSGFVMWILSTHSHYDCLGGYDKDFKIIYIDYSKKSLGASKQIPIYQNRITNSLQNLSEIPEFIVLQELPVPVSNQIDYSHWSFAKHRKIES